MTDEAKGTSIIVKSNSSGDFTADHLIPDVYDVTVAATGFEGFQQKGIEVNADNSIKVTPALKAGGANQTVEAYASLNPELKTDRADVSTEFDNRDVQSLPVEGRNFTSLQLLLPGRNYLAGTTRLMRIPRAASRFRLTARPSAAWDIFWTDRQSGSDPRHYRRESSA